MEELNRFRSELSILIHENVITDKDIYSLVFMGYMVNKYNLDINGKFENKIVFISYIQESIDNLSYSKDELSLLSEALNNIMYSLSDYSVKRIVKFICNYDKQVFVEFILTPINGFRDPYMNVPESLSELVLKIINKNGSILDLCCGNGDFLVKAVDKNCDYSVTGYERSLHRLLNARIRMLMMNCYYNFEHTSPLEHPIDDLKYDSIFCIPPFGERVDNDKLNTTNFEIKKTNTNYWYYVDRILSMLKPKGKGVIILPELPMFKNPDSTIREYLVKNKLVEAIIELPEKIFRNTGIGTIMLVLSKNNNYCRLIDARDMCFKVNRTTNSIDVDKVYNSYTEENEKVKLVVDRDFEERGYSFIPSKYINNITNEMKNPKLLKEYVTITRGYRGKPTNGENTKKCKYIKLSNISDGEIIKDDLEMIDYDITMDKILIQDKDILITARGSRFESAIIRIEDDEKVVCSDGYFILRVVNSDLNPYYLNVYLNSELGQQAIFVNQIKSAALIINANGLLNTFIDFISKEKQEEIEKIELKKYSVKEQYKKEIVRLKKEIDKIIK